MTSLTPRAPLFTRADFDLRDRGSMDPELRVRLERWSERVTARIAELGVALESCVIDGKSGPPGVIFVRNARSREQALRVARAQKLDFRPLFAGVFAENAKLVLRLTHATVEARLEIPATALVDIANLRAKIADPVGLLAATSAVEALPEQFWGGVDSGSQGPTARVTETELRAWLEETVSTNGCLFFGWTLPKDIAVSQKTELGEVLEAALSALSDLYDVLAWSEQNDFFGVQRRRTSRMLEPETSGPRSRKKNRHQNSHSNAAKTSRRARIADELEAEAENLATADEAPASNGESREGREGRAGLLFPRKRPILRHATRAADVDPRRPIEKGTRICALYGPFSGKIGIVQELDGKGGARVLFGLLAARVAVSDVVACAEKKEQKKLMSSHRKPLGR